MKFLEYILKFGFMFGLSVALVCAAGPAFYNKAKLDMTNQKSADGLKYFNLDYVFESEKYIQLKLITDMNDTISRNYYIPDKEHENIVSFLIIKKFTLTKNIAKILPLELTGQQLKSIGDVNFKLNRNHIELLAIDNYYLVGNKLSLMEKIIYYLLGTIFIIIGLLAFVLSSLVFYDTIKVYQKTDEFPNLPNSINSKIEGIKHIFSGFKSR
jgi:hypothetical protein